MKKQLTPSHILVSGFAIIILIGTILLMLPFASRDGQSISFINALFTATSAACVTGLVVVDTAHQFSMFGQIVILLLIQVGGLGFMSFATLYAFALRKRITLKDRLLLKESLNANSMEGIVRLFRRLLLFAFTIEGIAAIILSIRWSFDFGIAKGIYYGIFHSISLFNSAGFDIFGTETGHFSSLTSYTNDLIINFVTIILILLGGIGFVVMADVVDNKRFRKLTLHSKVAISTTVILSLVGTIVIFIFEFTNASTLGSLDGIGKFFASFLQSTTPRSVGVSTIDIGSMRQATLFFIIILMFIGASPGSTGGGIKTTTFTVMIGAVYAMVRGRENIVLFRYRIGMQQILKAVTVTLVALFVVVGMSMVLSTTEEAPFLTILFEVTSAFGTVGLSMGLTSELTAFGKLMIVLTMFAGRLGLLTLVIALGSKVQKELYRYPEGKITIG